MGVEKGVRVNHEFSEKRKKRKRRKHDGGLGGEPLTLSLATKLLILQGSHLLPI